MQSARSEDRPSLPPGKNVSQFAPVFYPVSVEERSGFSSKTAALQLAGKLRHENK
jgi:hypothetical protein